MDSKAGPGTPSPVPLRASDAERDQVVGQLRERFAEGRLTQDSFVQRMDVALQARERGELADLMADLPSPPHQSGLRARLDAVAAAARRVRRRCQDAIRPPARGSAPPAARPVPGWPVLHFPPGRTGWFIIGRDDGCDLVLDDLSVSRRHARLQRDGDSTGWLLEDLGSTNGTRLNGWRVRGPVPVRPGDQVSFGAARFRLADQR